MKMKIGSVLDSKSETLDLDKNKDLNIYRDSN